ncbi:MAG: hypothetical protein JO256_03510 [Alphaproteobacteria bacterium]|nr:hypothetical protein [Alphaproteobacteria bacterium]
MGEPVDKPFQRVGAISNAHAGADFESVARDFFLKKESLTLSSNFDVLLGARNHKKHRRFDLGCDGDKPTLIECKSHKWTAENNIPSAKITVWNESMYYFHFAPSAYRKILFVLKDSRARGGESLAAYYIRNYGHLIPHSVEIWEYDVLAGDAVRIH